MICLRFPIQKRLELTYGSQTILENTFFIVIINPTCYCIRIYDDSIVTQRQLQPMVWNRISLTWMASNTNW